MFYRLPLFSAHPARLFIRAGRSCVTLLLGAMLSCSYLAAALPASVESPSRSVTPAPPDGVLEEPQPLGISGNPAAIDATTGLGTAQDLIEKWSGIKDDHGVRLGGLWLADVNWIASGGARPGKVSENSLLILDAHIDFEKMTKGAWKGGSFGAEFLQFNGAQTNQDAGSAQGFNSLPGPAPLDRSELYQLWIRQSFLDDKITIRLGKVTPTSDFGNVLRPVPLEEENLFIPSVSGLLFTPVFINPTAIGVMPGYYNSAGGVTLNIAPVKWWYLNVGFYDGNIARGVQTGLTGPHFNGSYFTIAETGFAWRLGAGRLPGSFGAGGWHQSGTLPGPPGLTEEGANGGYFFASQRLWDMHPGKDNSGVSAYVQYGINDSDTLPFNEYVGGGLTAFALVPCRPNDSLGVGFAYSWLNKNLFPRSNELILQTYYQYNVTKGVYFEPAVSYIPTPGAGVDLPAAWGTTFRLTVLF